MEIAQRRSRFKNSKNLIILVSAGLILVAGVIVFLCFLLKRDFVISEYPVFVEVSKEHPYIAPEFKVCFGNSFTCEELAVEKIGEIDPEKPGEYTIEYKYSHGENSGSSYQYVKVLDETPPEIKVPGDNPVSVYVNAEYKDAGAEATDNYDENVMVETVITPTGSDSDKVDTVDTSKTGEFTITARDQAGNVATATRTVKVVEKPAAPAVSHGGNASKIVYLTFDDGPSAYTSKLLDVLKKYGVKATFFVTCSGSDEMIKREYNEGHTVALHTCSHNYAQIYASDAAFFADLERIQARVKNLTGYTATLTRFPGGSSNTVSAAYNRGIMSRLVKSVTTRGFTYFDWNVSSGDAGGAISSDAVYRNVVSGMGRYEGGAVVLQHDVKSFSVDAVEQIIQYGQAHGFEFRALTASSNTARHGVNN